MPTRLTARLLKFQMPIYRQAIADKKPFGEAVALAKNVPWPEGLKTSSLLEITTHEFTEEEKRARDEIAREDKEGEKRKREERARQAAEDKAREKAERLRSKALKTYNVETDALRVKTFSVTNPDHPEITFEGTPLHFASRIFERIDMVTQEGERISLMDKGGNVLCAKVADLSRVDHMGRRITPVRLDISDEVRQAIQLPLIQRKAFGAAKDRGLSDADALAFAKNTPPE